MPLLYMVILALLQGVAEFLPISSSGHLVIVAAILHAMDPSSTTSITDVNIILHLGTLGSIVVFYWQELTGILTRHRRLMPILIVATIPVGIIGLIIKKKFEFIMGDSLLAGFMLLGTATMLLVSQRLANGETKYQDVSYRQAWGIGLFQAIAILPGISRSGSTISSGLLFGLGRADAAIFSFLMAVPAIGGACFLEILDLLEEPSLSTPIQTLAIGAFISFAVGLASLGWLMRLLKRGQLQWFAYWCIVVGIGVIIWQLVFLSPEDTSGLTRWLRGT
jgi:undecaprenyl-diphosphatase